MRCLHIMIIWTTFIHISKPDLVDDWLIVFIRNIVTNKTAIMDKNWNLKSRNCKVVNFILQTTDFKRSARVKFDKIPFREIEGESKLMDKTLRDEKTHLNK